MELSLIGLQNSGKTSLVNVIATGGYSEDMIPTVGFNMRKVTKGNVTIKLWDLGGQPRFRSMWERYCRAVSAIVPLNTLDSVHSCREVQVPYSVFSDVCPTWLATQPQPVTNEILITKILKPHQSRVPLEPSPTNRTLMMRGYVVDAADYDNVPVSRSELHDLLSKPSLNGIPLLVLGNKIDKHGALSKEDLTEQFIQSQVSCLLIAPLH
uniref:Uncharacterized protein n=1 Tax=Fagus sylvatica TaxID=28930 RepID=A0A2N9J8I0_FAGSY